MRPRYQTYIADSIEFTPTVFVHEPESDPERLVMLISPTGTGGAFSNVKARLKRRKGSGRLPSNLVTGTENDPFGPGGETTWFSYSLYPLVGKAKPELNNRLLTSRFGQYEVHFSQTRSEEDTFARRSKIAFHNRFVHLIPSSEIVTRYPWG